MNNILPIIVRVLILIGIAAAAGLIVTALAGCAIPIPPTGQDLGKYGTVHVGIKYVPSETTADYVGADKIILNPKR